jgi:bis(5'-nucleosyl)-tetraphosphatase (symmetrical)
MRRVFAVGDVQGCFSELQTLIKKIGANNIDQLWLTGDLVNRGPESLETLRWCVRNKHWIRVVLGNHDLHLLAVAAGIRPQKPGDTLDQILMAPDREVLLNWLRNQPLAHFGQGHLMVHAGVLPSWSAEHALELSGEVSKQLRHDDWKVFLSTMYGNWPIKWHSALRGPDRSRVIINAMTRLRFCSSNGEMDFDVKEGLNAAPTGFIPWFKVPTRLTESTNIVFGHWSTLGLLCTKHLNGVDTGCIWGGPLTAIALHDQRVVQIPSQQKSHANNTNVRVPGQ